MSHLEDRLLRVAMSGVVPKDDPHVIADAQAEIERLRASLKPFADYVDQLDGTIPYSGSGPSMKDWLAAHEALNQQTGSKT